MIESAICASGIFSAGLFPAGLFPAGIFPAGIFPAAIFHARPLSRVNYCVTFKACPSNFYQLFTIIILINVDNHSFPRVFALLHNKTEECYKRLYSIVKELIAEEPLTVISDYEKASINALTSVFPMVEHQGCSLRTVII